MALDLEQIKETIIKSIKHSIGDQLFQAENPDTGQEEGMVLQTRQDIPEQMYPYVLLDLLEIKDTDWYLTSMCYDETEDKHGYNTHKDLRFQISVYGNIEHGGEAMYLANCLATSYRREDMLMILREGNVSLGNVEEVPLAAELLATDYLEGAFLRMTVRVNDLYIDPELQSIENVIIEGELDCNRGEDPLDVNVDTTT